MPMKANIDKLRQMVKHHCDNAEQACTNRDNNLLQICGLEEELRQANVAIEESRATCLSNEGEIVTLRTKLSEMDSVLVNATKDAAALTNRIAYLEGELKNATTVSDCRVDLLNVKHALRQSENQLEELCKEIEFCHNQLDQKNQVITELRQTISHYQANEDSSLSVSNMSVDNDHNHDETNMESNDNTIPETNDDVFFDTNNNDESSEVCHDFQERTDYEEIIAKLKDQNASLQSQLLQASTKKYGPISTCISLDDIPDESKLETKGAISLTVFQRSFVQSYSNAGDPTKTRKDNHRQMQLEQLCHENLVKTERLHERRLESGIRRVELSRLSIHVYGRVLY